MQITQFRFIPAPMNLGMSDRVAILNIYVRDLQAGGARIFSTRQYYDKESGQDGFLIEFMGEPEPLPESSISEVSEDDG